MRLSDALTIGASALSLQRSQWRSTVHIREQQRVQLMATLAFALDRVPHYRGLRIDRRDGDPGRWLAQFPVLTKQHVQAAGSALIAEGVDENQLFASRTSGSTGEPTVSRFDRHSWLISRYALKLRRMLNFGLGIGARVLIVSEAHASELQEHRKGRMLAAGWLFRQEYISLRTPLDVHLQTIRQLRPDAIYAFPSYFADLLDHCERAGVDLPPIRVVFTSSEVLPASLRRRLQQRLGASVCDVYGCTEFKEVAWQCEIGRYHVNHESVWIESERVAPHDGRGTLLLTTLINRAAPLIRYRVGDLGGLQWVRCACGREGPVLSELEGREVELLELADGRRLSPYLLTTAVEDVAGLRQYQFVQTAADRLEMRFVARDGQSVDEERLQARLDGLLAGAIQVRLLRVPAIPRTSGGKHKVFTRGAPYSGTC